MDSVRIPSFTSYAVAKGYYAMGNGKFGNLANQESLQILGSIIKKVESYPKYRKISRLPNFLVPKILDLVGLRGLSLHYVLRKNYIEKKLREFLSAGHKQIVIIGGGLDTLAIRLANEFNDLVIIEIDQAATQIIKQDFVTNAKSKIVFDTSNLQEKPLPDILAKIKEFDHSKPTFFICEGVLMYLKQETVDGIFEYISKFPSEAYFVFTALDQLEGIRNDLQFLMLKKIVGRKNEAFVSATPSSNLKNMPKIDVLEKFTYRELQAPYRNPKYTAKLSEYSEYICFIKRK